MELPGTQRKANQSLMLPSLDKPTVEHTSRSSLSNSKYRSKYQQSALSPMPGKVHANKLHMASKLTHNTSIGESHLEGGTRKARLINKISN